MLMTEFAPDHRDVGCDRFCRKFITKRQMTIWRRPKRPIAIFQSNGNLQREADI